MVGVIAASRPRECLFRGETVDAMHVFERTWRQRAAAKAEGVSR
jgi:hypothetical protein